MKITPAAKDSPAEADVCVRLCSNIVEFLKTLTGSNFDELILDAHAAPIGDVSLEDPNWFHENKLKY